MKILLILGASSEIGISLIERVSSQYDYILAHYNKTANELIKLKELIGEKLIIKQSDFSNEIDTLKFVNNIFEEGIIPTHIVHLPAMNIQLSHFNKIEWSTFEKGFNISLRSIVIILRNILPLMAKKKQGKVIFMLTTSTENIPPKFLSDYITVKYALLGLLKTLAIEYEGKGIMMNGVSPDMMETDFLHDIPELVVKQNAMKQSTGRNLTVDNVIPLIDFLLSEGGDSISGQNIAINIAR